MTRAARLLTAATMLVLLPACGAHPLAGVAQTRGFNATAQSAPGQLIVRFKSQARQALLQNLGLKTVKKVAALNAVVVKAADPAAATAALKADREVLWVEPNFIAKASETAPVRVALPLGVGARAADELLGQLWGMAKIEAPAAWAVTTGDRNVKLAIVDTGIDHQHPELAGRVDKGHDFINDDDDAMDDNEHGTHCAGTAAGGINNGGVVGVAPNVSLLAVKVLDKDGSGTYEAVANGIIFAADQGAAVISMSLGGPAGSKVIEDAVNHARSKGALVVAAMGNENTEKPSYPASARGVMAVGATTKADQRSSFSNFGKHISVGAPGSEILSSVPGGKFDTFSGTSMATPHVAGLAALVKSRFPQADAAELKARIEKATDDLGQAGFDKNFGHGRINARKALI